MGYSCSWLNCHQGVASIHSFFGQAMKSKEKAQAGRSPSSYTSMEETEGPSEFPLVLKMGRCSDACLQGQDSGERQENCISSRLASATSDISAGVAWQGLVFALKDLIYVHVCAFTLKHIICTMWNSAGGEQKILNFSELNLQPVVSCSTWMVGTKPGSLQEQQVLLTVQHLSSFLACFSNRSHIA